MVIERDEGSEQARRAEEAEQARRAEEAEQAKQAEQVESGESGVSSVDAMRKLGGVIPLPTSEIDASGSQMHLGANGDEEARRAEEARRVEEAERVEQAGEKKEKNRKKDRYEKDPELVEWRTDRNFKKMAGDLYKLNEIGENGNNEEREKIRERLTKNYQKLVKTELYQVSTMLSDTTMRYLPPYPYDSREQQYFFSGIEKGVKDLVLEFEDGSKIDSEVKEWLNLLENDRLWGKGVVNVLEGLGPMVKSFWSGTNMMGAVREKMRKDPAGNDFLEVFAKKLDGLEKTDKTEEIWSKKGVEKGVEGGLRELAIKFQDENVFWGVAVAAVEQLEYDKDGNINTFVDLTKKEIEFIQLLFGEEDKNKWVEYKGKEFPKGIKNFYTMKTNGRNINKYESWMESLLCLGIKEKLERGEKIIDLVKNVKELSEKKSRFLYGIYDRDINSSLAEVVVKTGIGFNWGLGISSEIGWGWKYKKNKDGEVLRSTTSGSTRAAMDWSTERYWLWSHLSNKVKGWTFSSIFPKFSNDMRVVVNEHRPNFKPNFKNDEDSEELMKIEKATKGDRVYKRAMDYLDSYDWSKEEKEWLDENLWWWDTGIVGSDGKRVVLPIFFPTEIEGMNFWDTISLKGKGRINKYSKDEHGDPVNPDPSVWEEMCKKGKMSDMEWDMMENQDVYTWMITLSQALFETTVLLQEENKNNKDTFDKFFRSSDQLGEIVKRVMLGMRDGKGSKAMLSLSYVSLIVPLYVAKKQAGIAGENGADVDKQGIFHRYMSDWIDEAEGLWIKGDGLIPEEEEPKEPPKKASERLAHMLQFYTALISELGFVLGIDKDNETNEMYKDTKGVSIKITGRKGIPQYPPEYPRL